MDSRDDDVTDIVPTAEEYDAVGAALSGLAGRAGGGQRLSLNSLLGQWGALVDDVEDGYPWCAPEFDNDLWCRGALANVWPLLPPRVRSIRQPELDGIDGRYRRATVPWPDRPQHGAGWWTWRVPRRLEVEASQRRGSDWPWGWETLPFPRPDTVDVVAWDSPGAPVAGPVLRRATPAPRAVGPRTGATPPVADT